MNISGIHTCAGFYDYNTIKSQEARNQQIAESKAEMLEETMQEDTAQQEEPVREVEQEESDSQPDLGAAWYASQYRPDAAYELKGADSEISGLDIEKALSDLQKDQVLMQYQVFVGDSRGSEESLKSRTDENFYL